MKKKISVDAGVYVLFCMYLLLLGPAWGFAIATAAMIHEMGHLLLLWSLDYRIWSIRVSCGGIRIDTEYLSGAKGILIALAGPACGLVLLFFWRWIPKISFCGLVQSLFNLLPFYPLDGGRALRCWREQKAVAKYREKGYNESD